MQSARWVNGCVPGFSRHAVCVRHTMISNALGGFGNVQDTVAYVAIHRLKPE